MFTKLIGKEELERLESAGAGFSPTDGAPSMEPAAESAKAETPAASANAEASKAKSEAAEPTEASCVGAKRKARMALVDDMRGTTSTKGAPAEHAKPARPTKSRCVD